MKKILFSFMTLALVTLTFAAPVSKYPPLKASDILIPVGNTGKMISLQDLADIKVRDFQALTGRHMSLFDKATFKLTQRQLRQQINRDGSLNKKKFEKMVQKYDGASGFHLGGFALGFLIGLIGVLIAYLINDDYKKNRVKWAWIGFAIGLVIGIVIFVI